MINSRKNLETNFKTVQARIVWGKESPRTVTIANIKQEQDLEACDTCGRCNNCKVDGNMHYYAENLTELDELVQNHHHDGWKILHYSVME